MNKSLAFVHNFELLFIHTEFRVARFDHVQVQHSNCCHLREMCQKNYSLKYGGLSSNNIDRRIVDNVNLFIHLNM